MFDLSGKLALVTGASGGIGRAIAVSLAAQGAKVLLAGRNIEALEETKKAISGDAIVLAAADLSSAEGIKALMTAALEHGEAIDILVNNAGFTKDGLAMRMKAEDWQSVLDVNLTAPFMLAQAAIKGMMKKRTGRIINISSIVGTTGNPGQANYCATKAGIIGWSKSLAQEIASRNITVNCISPGFIATPMTDELNEKQKEALLANIPLGKMGKPEDIAAAVVYLASDEAAWVTGQNLHINGGMAMI
ncbi:MAG: 3-oxoacyl-[acyl-carrier-protein] reductase [Alphaproteobacteria bacterium]